MEDFCLFGNSLGGKQSLSVFGNVVSPAHTTRDAVTFSRRRLQVDRFTSIDFKMDVVPEDDECSGQTSRDRTASLNSLPQVPSANFRNSTLRLRSSIASMQSVTCVYLVFRYFGSFSPLHRTVAQMLNPLKSSRLFLAGICYALLRVCLGSKRVDYPMSIGKHDVYHLLLLPRPPHPSFLRPPVDSSALVYSCSRRDKLVQQLSGGLKTKIPRIMVL